MKKNSLLDIYNNTYAANYNEKFLTNPFSRVSSDYELEILKGLIRPDTHWLDAGCGTGYYLGYFPGINRAGLDISPDMLAEARKANPDIEIFREGDFRMDIPEWHDQFSLISCMWYPYSYLESVTEVENMIKNFMMWLKPGGDFFMPLADLHDLRPSLPEIPYEQYEEVYGGKILITSYTWTLIEDHNAGTHVHMVAPHVEHVIRLLEPYFDTIEIVRYPPAYEGWVSRRAIIARGRRNAENTGVQPACIIRHPVPSPANASPETDIPQTLTVMDNPLVQASHQQLFGELFSRIRSGRLIKSIAKKLLGRS